MEVPYMYEISKEDIDRSDLRAGARADQADLCGAGGGHRAGAAEGLGRALFFGFPEHGEFFFESGEGFLVFELKPVPFPFKTFPFLGQLHEAFGDDNTKPAIAPKRRIFLRPEPEDAVMRGNQLDALPEQRPRRVRQ